MRKKLLKAISVFVVVLFTLTSCLGDTESTRTLTNQNVYIDNDEIGIFANLYYLGIRSADLGNNGLEPGDCAVISFKYNLKNSYGDGTFDADYVTLREEQIYKKRDHIYSRTAEVDTANLASDRHFFESIENTSVFGYPTAFWGNKWFFQYRYAKGKGNIDPELRISYDATKQGVTKEAGKRYADLELVWDGDNTITGDVEYVTKIVVLDLTNIRNALENEGAFDSDKNVNIHLRYFEGNIANETANPKLTTKSSTIYFDYRTEEDYGQDFN